MTILSLLWLNPAPKSKSATDKLVDSFSGIRSEAKKSMSEEEFRKAEEEFDRVVAKVRASWV
jgi:hypothetical protein